MVRSIHRILKKRIVAVTLCVVSGLFACCAGTADAHPQLAGRWVSPTPPGGLIAYTFEVGQHLGNGVWRGDFTLFIANLPPQTGCYELRMYNDSEGTLSELSSTTNINGAVGIVDMGKGTYQVHGTSYRRGAPVPAIVPVAPPAP